ncbi:glycosyl transferase family group 2-domain-containing protein [Lactifluus subvellereus]|nr:glycosyl transferase family group 2-domain-containing protein [Lactifluus subvellereus]
MQTYVCRGGRSNIFINDDGRQTLPDSERALHLAFYEANGIRWLARPADGEPSANGDSTKFMRAGRFKKTSNMNYALELSRRPERHLRDMAVAGETSTAMSGHGSLSGEGSGSSENDQALSASLEDRALLRAVEETWEESGKRWKPWAKNGKACRIGEIVLLVDSDTLVPEVRPKSSLTRESSDSLSAAYIRANGEVAPFVDHNAFLRWQAVQDAAFIIGDGKEKIWSESHVSEDFDLAMRLQMRGYIIRWATYSEGGFKEGVSLTVDDELNRWQKYAYSTCLTFSGDAGNSQHLFCSHSE